MEKTRIQGQTSEEKGGTERRAGEQGGSVGLEEARNEIRQACLTPEATWDQHETTLILETNIAPRFLPFALWAL